MPMSTFSKMLFLNAVFLLFCLSPAMAASDPHTDFFHDSFGDLKEELDQARDENKQGVMLFFEMDDCPFCHRMKKSVLSKADVQSYFREHFRLLTIDIEGDIELTDFNGEATTQKDFAFQQHRVRATPVIAFFDLEGTKVAKYTGATGTPEEFMLLGKYVAEGHYKNMPFTKFKRQQK